MRELLTLCLGRILAALVIWLPILVGSVALLSLLVVRWSRRRMMRAGFGQAPSRLRRGGVWLLLISLQLVGLPLVALFTAIPFALERGVAATLESPPPPLIDWGIRTGVNAVKERLRIKGSDPIVDLRGAAEILDNARPVAVRARGVLGAVSSLPQIAANQTVTALRSVLDRAVAPTPGLTWDDLFTATHAQVRAAWQRQGRAAGLLIRAASLRHLTFLSTTVLLADGLTLLLIWLVIRPGDEEVGVIGAGSAGTGSTEAESAGEETEGGAAK
jgi:hypothetical protein